MFVFYIKSKMNQGYLMKKIKDSQGQDKVYASRSHGRKIPVSWLKTILTF